jgi:hypothetical protein
MKIFPFLLVSLLIIFFSTGLAQQAKIQANIGLLKKSGDKITRIKTNDRAMVGDQMRIFIQPLQDSYLYVIYSDGINTHLLTTKETETNIKKNKVLLLPSDTEFYVFDDKSKNGFVTIICSSTPVSDIESNFKGKSELKHKEWAILEAKLTKEFKTDLHKKSDKPISIAGNVRGMNDDFRNQLQTFSDEKVIMKKFTLEIKK